MSNSNQTFVVRIWFEPSASGSIWRACCTNVRTQQKHYFKSHEELHAFLNEHQFQQPKATLSA